VLTERPPSTVPRRPDHVAENPPLSRRTRSTQPVKKKEKRKKNKK